MIEFFIYAKNAAPVDIGALKRTLNDAGMAMCVARNWLKSRHMEIAVEGELRHNDSTVGCRVSSSISEAFEQAVARMDHVKLKQWVAEGRLGYAMWSSRAFSFAEHSEFESIEDARAQMGDGYADFLAQAKRQYIVTNCNEPEFCAATMGAVAMVGNGLVEDPQLGVTIAAPSTSHEVSEFINRWPN